MCFRVPVVAVSLGATVIEKHFVLDRQKGGIDAAFSMEPQEFKEMVLAVKDAKDALGIISYDLTDRNKQRRRSIFVSKDVKKDELITSENIKSIRPGNGLHPMYYYDILNKKFSKDLKAGTPLTWEMLW